MTGAPVPDSGLTLEGVRVALQGRTLLALSDHVGPSEVLTVMGPSGSGKSSLLAYVAGTLAPAFTASGAVWLNGRRLNGLPTERRRTGLLFQDDLLFPHLSVGGNLGFALPPTLRGRAARRAAVSRALDQAGLGGFADRDPATLSGGQRARVAEMRTLLAEPEALLLDEPFGKLDQTLRADFRRFVFDHARANRLPVLLVTHDAADAEASGGRVVRIGDTP